MSTHVITRRLTQVDLAKMRASSRSAAVSKCTTTESATAMAAADPLAAAREKASSGGSADTEATEEAVMPTGPVPEADHAD